MHTDKKKLEGGKMTSITILSIHTLPRPKFGKSLELIFIERTTYKFRFASVFLS